jgi:hypothetical protein
MQKEKLLKLLNTLKLNLSLNDNIKLRRHFIAIEKYLLKK